MLFLQMSNMNAFTFQGQVATVIIGSNCIFSGADDINFMVEPISNECEFSQHLV